MPALSEVSPELHAASQSHEGATLQLAPTLYLPMQEVNGTNAKDFAGSNDGTYTNTPDLGVRTGRISRVAGVSRSPYFDALAAGGQPHVLISDNAGLRFGTGAFTLSCWAYLTAFTKPTPCIAGKGDTAAGEWMWNIGVAGSGLQRFFGDGGAVSASAAGGSVSVGTWYHCAVVRNGAILAVYQNGSQVALDGTASSDFSTTKAIQLAGADSDINRWLDGKLAHFAAWVGTALSQAEINMLYLTGKNGG